MLHRTRIFFLLFAVNRVQSNETADKYFIKGCTERVEERDHVLISYVVKGAASARVTFSTASYEQTYLPIGMSGVSPVWNGGLIGMCPGETRTLTFSNQEMKGFFPKVVYSADLEEEGLQAKVVLQNLTKAKDFAVFAALDSGRLGSVVDSLEKNVGINALDMYGSTLLMAAVQGGMQIVFAALLNKGKKVDVNYAKPSGHTAVFYSVAGSLKENISMLKMLIKRGADVNTSLKQPDSAGWTPLHYACKLERLDHVKILLDAGADVLAVTAAGETVMDVASSSDYSVRKKLADMLNEAFLRIEEQDL